MPGAELQLVEQFFRSYRDAEASMTSGEYLHESSSYDLLIAKDPPTRACFYGRRAVKDYLSVAQASYQVIEAKTTTLFPHRNVVFVRGGETARLLYGRQLVDTEWICTFEFEDNLIRRVTMCVYRWQPSQSSDA